MKREIHFIYYFASSSDGLVADSAGGVEWLNAFHDADYGFNQFLRRIDGVVMGRKTYEQSLGFGKWQLSGTPVVVLSRTRTEGPHVEFWSRPVSELTDFFANKNVKNVWVMGGGQTAAAFLQAGLLDEVEQYVMPIVLGSGVPAFGPLTSPVRLRLEQSKSYHNGVLMLKYLAGGKVPNTGRATTRPKKKSPKKA